MKVSYFGHCYLKNFYNHKEKKALKFFKFFSCCFVSLRICDERKFFCLVCTGYESAKVRKVIIFMRDSFCVRGNP